MLVCSSIFTNTTTALICSVPVNPSLRNSITAFSLNICYGLSFTTFSWIADSCSMVATIFPTFIATPFSYEIHLTCPKEDHMIHYPSPSNNFLPPLKARWCWVNRPSRGFSRHPIILLLMLITMSCKLFFQDSNSLTNTLCMFTSSYIASIYCRQCIIVRECDAI